MPDLLREKPIQRRRSMWLGTHRTSVTMEDVFWERFKAVAQDQGMRPGELAKKIADVVGPDANLSASLRCFLIEHALAEIGRLKRALPY